MGHPGSKSFGPPPLQRVQGRGFPQKVGEPGRQELTRVSGGGSASGQEWQADTERFLLELDVEEYVSQILGRTSESPVEIVWGPEKTFQD